MKRLLLVVAANCLLGGCGSPFLHTHAAPGEMTTDPGLVGQWVTLPSNPTQTSAVISSPEKPGSPYLASLVVHHKGEFKTALGVELTLTDIAHARYADLLLAKPDRERMVGQYGFLALPVHQVLKLERKGDVLRVWMFNGDWLASHPHAAGVTTDTVPIGGGTIAFVSASTDRVRELLAEHGDDAGVFAEPVVFRRVVEPPEAETP
jgi:hypothetical protein